MIEILFEGLLILICFVIAWQMFLSDIFMPIFFSIRDALTKIGYKKNMKLRAENLSKIKLLSYDCKEIEKFIDDNTEFLSKDHVNKLVDRIAELRADQAINNELWRIDYGSKIKEGPDAKKTGTKRTRN